MIWGLNILNDRFKIIRDTITEMIKVFYGYMEDYLQNIFSAASTINRVLSYYKIGISTDDKNKRYIIFYRNCNNFYIVREFDFEDFFGVDLNG